MRTEVHNDVANKRSTSKIIRQLESDADPVMGLVTDPVTNSVWSRSLAGKSSAPFSEARRDLEIHIWIHNSDEVLLVFAFNRPHIAQFKHFVK